MPSMMIYSSEEKEKEKAEDIKPEGDRQEKEGDEEEIPLVRTENLWSVS